MNFRAALLTFVLLFSTTPLTAGTTLGLSDKAQLQAAMQAHIERASVAGRFLHIYSEDGVVRPLRPQVAHPKILRMEEYFVVCAEFEAPDGANVNIDFFVARRGKQFFVFDQQVDNRAFVRQLMKSGKAELLR